ncbi:MAG: hypothetical protein KY462_01590 [Actinobacteria bacterium]|nr:hypothetical protein [Actinomycetota bacterium]
MTLVLPSSINTPAFDHARSKLGGSPARRCRAGRSADFSNSQEAEEGHRQDAAIDTLQ